MMLATNERGVIMSMFVLVHLFVIYCTSVAAAAYDSTAPNVTTTNHTTHPPSQNPINSSIHEPPDRVVLSTKSKVEEASHQSRVNKNRHQNVPQEQRIALQIVIVDPPNSTKRTIDNHKRHTNLVIGWKRPYDAIMQDVAEKYSPSSKHFYMLDAIPPKDDIVHRDDLSVEQQPIQRVKQQQTNAGAMKPPKGDQQSAMSMLNQKIELMRTQHKPPWQTISNQHSQAHLPPERRSELISGANRRYKLRFTTLAPSTTTTEFFRLISSAHSPIELITRTLASPQRKWNQSAMNSELDFKPYPQHQYHLQQQQQQSQQQEQQQYQHYQQQQQQQQESQRVQLPANLNISSLINVLTTAAPSTYYMDLNESSLQSRFNPNVSVGQVVSPTIVVMGDKEPEDHDGDLWRLNENSIEHGGGFPGDRSEANASLQVTNDGRPSFKIPLSASEVPTTFFNGKKKVTIIRHSPRPTKPSLILLPPPTLPSFISPPEKIKIEEDNTVSVPNLTITTIQESNNQAPTLVRLISKQKHKYDDNIRSSTLTVVDSHAIRMPPNATSVHNNKLIVAIRPGRPKHRHPPTTQFPVYNIVAGITPPYTTNPVQPQYTRPPSIYGQVYGLIKPNSTDATSTTTAPSNFGSLNIKFPAMSPSNLQPEHIEIPESVNISVPESANFVGPVGNKVPDKILMGIEEQHIRPPEHVILSDSTIVTRPHGSHTFTNHDGIMKLSTTRKPSRLSTTKRINIVSANTTVIHQTHQMSQPSRPATVSIRPSIFEYVRGLLNAGVTTSALAVLSIIKLLFYAILIMFLPPIALTAAITQVISMG